MNLKTTFSSRFQFLIILVLITAYRLILLKMTPTRQNDNENMYLTLSGKKKNSLKCCHEQQQQGYICHIIE